MLRKILNTENELINYRWPKSQSGSGESSFVEKSIVNGRLICDTYLNAKVSMILLSFLHISNMRIFNKNKT